ncbi:MAG: FAD-dependent oxidoreductase [Candidatus Desantisbacteria bacterium]
MKPLTLTRVAILGAGPAGLSAALRLAKQGVHVEVIEAEPQVGGLCRTIQHDDFFFDLGGHRFATKDKGLEQDIKELMGSELVTRPRCSTIWLNGKYINYPLELVDLLRKMNPFASTRCILDYFLAALARRVASSPDKTFEDWIIHRFGKGLYSAYFGPYSSKLWGIPPDLISADWAEYRITLINLWDIILRLFRLKKDTPTTYITNFYYPKSRGIGRIWEYTADAILDNGGIIHLNSTVEELQVDKNRVVFLKDRVLLNTIKYDFVICTIPCPELK